MIVWVLIVSIISFLLNYLLLLVVLSYLRIITELLEELKREQEKTAAFIHSFFTRKNVNGWILPNKIITTCGSRN